MHVAVEPRRVTVAHGAPAVLTVTVTNTTDLIAGFEVRVLGADPAWVSTVGEDPRLFPGTSAVVTVTVTLPDGVAAGERTVAFQVRDTTDATVMVVEDVVLEVPPAPRTTVALDPPTVTAGHRASFSAVVANEGNTVLRGTLALRDPEALTTYALRPATVDLAPGASTVVDIEATARRPWLGDQVMRPFEVRLDPALDPEAPPAAVGMFVQRPRISRGALGLIGLLLAITVFATVITAALSQVVSRSAADRNLAIQVAQARDETTADGTSGLSGSTVDLLSGDPAGGLSVGVFGADDPGDPVATTATAKDGTFSVEGLPAGTYTLRVRGAGYAEVWYPAAPTQDAAEEVEVAKGETTADLVVQVGGVPSTVSGKVSGDDVGGATVQLRIPVPDEPASQVANVLTAADEPSGAATADPEADTAVLMTVPVGADGTFTLTDVPSPGVYDLVVRKEGFADGVQRVDVAAGEVRDAVELPLLLGDGSITGMVTGASSALGGATVVATSGTTRVETVSLTNGDKGAFDLRDLPTPGTYTVVVTAPGYAASSLSLSLTDAQQLTGVSVVLGRDHVALGGTVRLDEGTTGTAAGVHVDVTDGRTSIATVTQSEPAGSWTVSGLPVPGTYTVKLTRDDLKPQVLAVSLDAYGRATAGAADASAVDVRMRSALARLTGVVRQERRGSLSLAPNVLVVVSSGDLRRTVHTASTPARAVGSYAVDALPPGTYTVTYSLPGSRPTSEVVVLEAADVVDQQARLKAPASLSGTVSPARAGLVVDLYLAAEYGTAAAPVATTTTGDGGRWSFDELDAPEHYVVEVRGPDAGIVMGTSTPIELGESEAERYDVPLVAGS